MWFFGSHNDEDQTATIHPPNIDQLNDFCISCPRCDHIHSLPDFAPLSIAKCENCEAPFFIPYRVYDFWLYRPLGGGGMGSVYRAISAVEEDSEQYAVKILPRDKKDDSYLIECLLQEATIGKSFGEHPHLTTVVDFGECDGEYFSAMSYVEGQRLDQLIEAPEHVSQKYVILWGLQVLSAEQRMYDAGYLYRDLKPQNLIIDGNGNIHLIDYGLCMSVEECSTENVTDSVEGSPLYMPPERIVGAPEGMNSEIYSLGMVMFHALTKKTYYSATGAFEIARKHVKSVRFNSVASKLPISVSPIIAKILDKMIARLPQDRYQTYKEAALDLRHIFNELDE